MTLISGSGFIPRIFIYGRVSFYLLGLLYDPCLRPVNQSSNLFIHITTLLSTIIYYHSIQQQTHVYRILVITMVFVLRTDKDLYVHVREVLQGIYVEYR